MLRRLPSAPQWTRKRERKQGKRDLTKGRGDPTKFQLLYKDDSEYNECYAEDWEERSSFKKILQTTEDVPVESAKCKCILPCEDTKIKRPPKTDGSHMELPWADIVLPERCDAELTPQISKRDCICELASPKVITEAPKLQCTCTRQQVVEEIKLKCGCPVEQKPKYAIEDSAPKSTADERKLKCICKLDKPEEKPVIIEDVQPKCICERKPLEITAKEQKPLEPKQKCNCQQKKPLVEETKLKCICTKPAAKEQLIEEPKPIINERKLKCTCKLRKAEEKLPKSTKEATGCRPCRPGTPITPPPVIEEVQPKCICERKPLESAVEEFLPVKQRLLKSTDEPKKCHCGKEAKPKCTCTKFLDDDDSEEQKSIYEIKEKVSTRTSEERKLKCTCKLSASKPVVEQLKSGPPRALAPEQPRPVVGELKCTCKRKSTIEEKLPEEPKQKCNCQQKATKPLIEESKLKCNCPRKPPAEDLKPKCICDQKKPVVEETKGKCTCKQQSFVKELVAQESKLICECKPTDSKQIKPVIKTFTCPGKRASRDAPTRIPIPIAETPRPSREEEGVNIVKPAVPEPVDIQPPTRVAQKGLCDCPTNVVPKSNMDQSPPKSNLLDENIPKSEQQALFDDGGQIQRDDPDQDNADPEQERTNEAPTNNEDTPQRAEGADESQAPEQSTSGEGQASGSGGTGGDDGKKPPEKEDALGPCQCSRSSMDEEQRCLEESRRSPMKLVYDDMCYEFNEPYMDALSRIYPDDCETYCGPSTEIPWSEILIPKGVKLRQAKKPKKEKFKATRSTNTDTNINKRL